MTSREAIEKALEEIRADKQAAKIYGNLELYQGCCDVEKQLVFALKIAEEYRIR